MIGFERLAEILGVLGKNGYSLNATKKEELRVFLEGVLEGKEGETSENIVSAFREKLKTEAKNELKTEELKTEAKNELSNEMQEKVNKLEQIEKEKTDLQTQLGAANTQKTELEKQLSKKGKELEAEKQKAEKEKAELQTKFDQEKQALEAKNKTTEQPKQSNAARYTAGIGVGVGLGLAAELIAFTALERTVKLEMLVMIGIAVTSALVVGGITYAVLPSTQVDGVKAQEVNKKGMQLLTNGS